MRFLTTLAKLSFLLFLLGARGSGGFDAPAQRWGIDVRLLEGICRYESDSGRLLAYHNKNGSWDVGYCMNNRPASKERPPIPSKRESIAEAAAELAYWRRQHRRFCEDLYAETGSCGTILWGKWRGVQGCQREHSWWGHYNWGFRVLSNSYDRKVKCFINNGFKKCQKKQWQGTPL